MRLSAPCKAIGFRTKDIYGKPFRLSDFRGKRVMLSFFRDASCPFCHFRIYELTHKYQHWKDQNLEIIAVFSDTSAKVRRFVAKHPRPFTMLADPNLQLYNHYGVERSSWALLKALLLRQPRILKGLFKGARVSNNPHPNIVPADFLLTEDGHIDRVWYGRDTGDHIPLDVVQQFIDQGQGAATSTPRSSLAT